MDPILVAVILALVFVASLRGSSAPAQPSVTVAPASGSSSQSSNALLFLIAVIILLIWLPSMG
ncbi:MAG TPA: hypothetical protein VJG32_16565 [Anaerolineae bacterium]|nr:hypothetical protein [Anaerolineae bacterium]